VAVSMPLAAPVIAAARLRGGNANSARGAAGFAAEAIGVARAAGCTGLIVVRLDSAYYAAKVIAAIRRAGARFSVTVPMSRKVAAEIAAIPEDAWTAIRYPRALWDDQLRAWVSDAEIAEIGYGGQAGRPGPQRPCGMPGGTDRAHAGCLLAGGGRELAAAFPLAAGPSAGRC
jgi:hypothetical protein